jgi:Fe-S-cluster containining protein
VSTGYADWVAVTIRSRATGTGADVPCGDCNACCRSAYFIHVEPDETEARRAIPKALLFPAPGRPAGHLVLGFDEQGRCPMLVDDRCSIYEARPRTCRAYDCRVFSATGLSAAEDGKPLVAERADRWHFDLDDPADRRTRAGVLAAVEGLRARGDLFPGGRIPPTNSGLAMAALVVHHLFLDAARPADDDVRAALLR